MSTGNDPVRLIADPACPERQRALLRLGADIAPPRDAEARVWAALAGAVGGAAIAGGAAAADTSTKTITTTTTVKGGLLSVKVVALTAALTALVALGVIVFAPTKDARPPAVAPPAPAIEPSAPRAPAPTDLAPIEVAPPEDLPAPKAAPMHRPIRSPARRLGEETTLIRDARQALRAGDTRRALRLLDEARQLFPSGVLQQERERLAIEALVKDGRRSEASARAAAFLRRYPDSPHAGEIRALGLGAPGAR